MSRPAHIEKQRENIYLEFLAEGMTEKEAEQAMEKRMEEILFDEERQHSGYDRYPAKPHPEDTLYTDEERSRWRI